jgi:hypothetical protein
MFTERIIAKNYFLWTCGDGRVIAHWVFKNVNTFCTGGRTLKVCFANKNKEIFNLSHYSRNPGKFIRFQS